MSVHYQGSTFRFLHCDNGLVSDDTPPPLRQARRFPASDKLTGGPDGGGGRSHTVDAEPQGLWGGVRRAWRGLPLRRGQGGAEGRGGLRRLPPRQPG